MMSQAARIDFHYVHGYFPEDDEFGDRELEEDEDEFDDEELDDEGLNEDEPEFTDPERESPWLEDLL